jgi:hypothetical protein
MSNDEKPVSVTIIPNTTALRLVEPVSAEGGGYVGLSDVPIMAWRVEIWAGGLTAAEPIGPHWDAIDPYLLLDGTKYIWPGNCEFSNELEALQALNEHEARVAGLLAKARLKKAKANG